eukprot:scaffold5937_cov275-Pinguiococcus_pyrenoidosus.AAC.16
MQRLLDEVQAPRGAEDTGYVQDTVARERERESRAKSGALVTDRSTQRACLLEQRLGRTRAT